jgi:probable rRNA maturation factor
VTSPHCQVEIDVAPELDARVDRQAVERAVQKALDVAGRVDTGRQAPAEVGPVAVSVRVTGDVEMRELNRAYRNVNRPTDVLSFAFQESGANVLPPDVPEQLGDVIIDFDYAVRQATELEHSLPMELAWLVIHGTLQLLGYGHASDAEAETMEALETQALRALGFRKG